MADNPAIKVAGVSKTFRLPHEKSTSIKSALINLQRGNRGYEKQRVLDDISFEVKKGEFFGIVGRNGSGKSTLLKLLAHIYTPDRGEISIAGNLTPFIELGVGFNAELSGRENVFLNGALLGFNRKDMQRMYKDIVSFAELEKFMDQKLKNYSSGMQVRLAFSIAIRAHTDILLIDEVLAVGDAAFQTKCLDVFKDLKAAGKTIVFISHDMAMVRQFCDRAMIIKNGAIVASGEPDKIAELYEIENMPTEQTVESINASIRRRDNKIIKAVRLLDAAGKEANTFKYDEEVSLELEFVDRKKMPFEHVGVAVYAADDGYVFGANTLNDKAEIQGQSLQYSFYPKVGKGRYYLKIGIFGETTDEVLEFFDHGPSFQVLDSPGNHDWQGIAKLEHQWKAP